MKVKVKESTISQDWGEVVDKSRNSITVSWDGVIGIYTVSKNTFEIKEDENDNR